MNVKLHKIAIHLPRMAIYLIVSIQSILICFSAEAALDQFAVTGKIFDENGDPLPGATVQEKGTTNGTISEIDGSFRLECSEDAILIISFVGYNKMEVPLNGRTVIDSQLALNSEQLGEVVVVGFGTLKKSDVTGALSSVSSKDFENQPTFRVDQALQGRASGVQVTQTDGGPAGSFKIRIRGANSINGSNAPLYIIDGSPGNIFTLNVNDIESMEILKDASATAIYGSRGANGVVLITTKNGRKGESSLMFDYYYGISNVTRKLPMLTPAEYAEGVNYREGTEVFTPEEIIALENGGGEDWQERLFQTGATSNYQLSFSGGKDKIDYFVSGNYYKAGGIIADQDFERYTLRAKINANLSEKLKVGLNVSGSRIENVGQRANMFVGLTWDMTTPAYDENGELNYTTIKPGIGNGRGNPLVPVKLNSLNRQRSEVWTNGFAEFQLTKNLILNISGMINQTFTKENSYIPIVVDAIGTGQIEDTNVENYQNANRLTYIYDESSKHRLQIDAVHEQYYSKYNYLSASSEGFFSDNTLYHELSLGSIQRITNNSNDQSLQSFLGRINYAFDGKYLLTASVRADGSSKFRDGNKWGVFPSGSLAWRISEESFLEQSEIVNDLKLRTSYGITGNQGIDALATHSPAVVSPDFNYPFTGSTATIGVAPSNRLANPDLTWEETAQFNIGLDAGLWQSRLTLSADYYIKRTTNLLLNRLLPSFVGPTVVTENVGEMENKGFGVSIGIIPVETPGWDISSNITISRNVNKVISLVTDEPIIPGETYGDVLPVWIEAGKSLGTFRGLLFEGVYQLGEEVEAAEYGRVPGQAKYADLNDDGIISEDDMTDIGNGNPDIIFGWNTDIRWKNLSLNLLFTGTTGNEIYNIQRAKMMNLGSLVFHASHADYKDRWTPENPSNIPSSRDNTEILSTQFIEDGSHLMLKNISISYSFSENPLFDKLGLNELKLYTSIENAFVLTKYTGYDPEATATGDRDIQVGIDYNTFPLARTFKFGIKLNF